jgi:hypothetical protein
MSPGQTDMSFSGQTETSLSGQTDVRVLQTIADLALPTRDGSSTGAVFFLVKLSLFAGQTFSVLWSNSLFLTCVCCQTIADLARKNPHVAKEVFDRQGWVTLHP